MTLSDTTLTEDLRGDQAPSVLAMGIKKVASQGKMMKLAFTYDTPVSNSNPGTCLFPGIAEA